MKIITIVITLVFAIVLSVTSIGTGQNLVVNSGFETGDGALVNQNC